MKPRAGRASLTRWIGLVAAVTVMGAATAVLALEDRRSSSEASQKKAPSESTKKSASGTGAVEQKLDQVIANQAEILKRFDQVMEELQIIKIRATMQ